MQTTPKANTILGYFFAFLGAVVMLAIAAWVGASTSKQVEELTNPMAVPRTGHAATALSGGKILLTGGHDSAGNLVAVSEIFDPATGNSTASATLTTARVNHTATLLADGRVLVAGGTGASGALSSAEIFDPANASAGFQAVGAMTAARTGHTATLLNNGSVLIAGGEATATAEIFDPATSTFTATTGNLTVARSGHSATLFTDDSVLLAGGNVNSMETYTPGQGFTLDLAAMSVVRTGHWALELSGTRLLLFQGDTNNTIEEYNPSTGTITPKGSLDFHASSATLLANGKILVLGSGVAGLYDPNAIPPAPDFTAFDETSVAGSSSLQRSGQSATQLSGDKKIYVAGGVDAQNLFQGAALFNPARIWTDKDDYQPGDNVILSGSGWKANEDVYLYAIDDTTQAWTYGSTVTADASGGFVVDPYFVVQLVQDGANFTVSAVGAQSAMQAEVKFTDATFNSLTVGSQTGTAVAGTGANVTYNIAANFTGNNTANTVTFSFAWNSTPPSGVTVDPFNPASVSAPPIGLKNSTLAIHTGGGTPAGIYSFTVTGTPTSGSTRSDTGTLTVGQAPAFTSPNSTTFTVLSPGTFNVTATGVPAPTFSFTGSLPSGVNLSSAGVLSGTPASGTAGDYIITITASNGIGSPATQIFTLHVDKIQPTFSSLTSSQTITRGTASISVGGRLNAGSGSVPTGTATVTVDAAPVATTSTFNGNLGNFTATVNTSSILASAIPYTITYSYLGDANYKSASDSSTTLTVNNPAPTLASINPTSGNLNQTLNVDFTGTNYFSGVTTVSFGANITVNTVTVNNSTSLTANITIGAGAATGARNVSVTNAAPGGGTATLTNGFTVINPTVNTTTTVTSSSPLNTSTYGENVTFTANVAAASGTNNPTGTVTVKIDGTPTADSPVSLGACDPAVAGTACASTSTSTLHVTGSPHSVEAIYAHTGNFVDSSAFLSGGQTVQPKTLTASIIGDPTKQYDCTADATLAPGNFKLTGLVGSENFTVTKTTGSYNSSDVATATTVSTTLAASDFTPDPGTFASDYNLPTSASGPGHITKADTTSTVTSNVNPSIIGQTVTFTATVTRNLPVSGCNPTGTVTFKDGGTALTGGTVALSGGSATFSTSTLSAGKRKITAVYSGDDNFYATGATAGSTAPEYEQWVQYNFIGFLQPVDNPGVLNNVWNTVKAGQTIPIKWQLMDYNNNIICDLSTLKPSPLGLTSIQVKCPNGPVVTDAIETVLDNAGSTVFRCDGTQFIYNWQTLKSWGGTCRVMTVRLADDTEHSANFSFTR
jgi:hypothetical protein